FGIFFEPQRGTGTAQDAIVTDSTFYGNYAGLADCGIEGSLPLTLTFAITSMVLLQSQGPITVVILDSGEN
ncbi:hypothetical protein BXQ27_34635, partial [Klebsiella aerogenes]